MENKKFQKLLRKVTSCHKSIDSLIKELDHLIARLEKDLTIQFGDKYFYFYNGFTQEEKLQQEKLRFEFIKLLMIDALMHYMNNRSSADDIVNVFNIFERILVFSYGENPDDHKVEIFHEENYGNVLDINDIKSLPLNTDSYNVKVELGLLDGQQD